MRNEKVLLDYRNKKVKVLFTFLSAYLRACMRPKVHCTSRFFTAVDVKLFRSIVCWVEPPVELCLLFAKAQISRLAAVNEKESGQGIWRVHFAWKRAELLNVFADA